MKTLLQSTLETQDGRYQTIEHELRSTGHKLVLVLATRCLSMGDWEGWQGGCTSDDSLLQSTLENWRVILQTIEHELRSTGPKLVPLLATRCLYQGLCLTEGQPDPKADHMSTWPYIVLLLTTSCLHFRGYIWSHVCMTKVVTHMATTCISLGEGQVDILCNRHSASQPAAIGQPTSHVTKYQPVRLWDGQIFGGRWTGSLTTLSPIPESQHSYWFPLGSDLPDLRSGKWQKWALQSVIYIWHYI